MYSTSGRLLGVMSLKIQIIYKSSLKQFCLYSNPQPETTESKDLKLLVSITQ